MNASVVTLHITDAETCSCTLLNAASAFLCCAHLRCSSTILWVTEMMWSPFQYLIRLKLSSVLTTSSAPGGAGPGWDGLHAAAWVRGV